MDRSMINAASEGALMDKTPTTARHLISNMTQQFGTRGTIAPRMVNEVDTIDSLRLENQLTELTSLVRQLAIGQHQSIVAVKACGICTSVEHPTNMCPTLQETKPDHPESVGSIGGYQYGKQPYANRPFEGQQFGRPPYRPNPNQKSYSAQGFSSNQSMPQSQGPLSTAESKIPGATVPTTIATKNATTSNMQFQQNMSAIVQDLKMQSAEFGNLPSQAIPNPRRNVSIVSLRSGKELQAAPQQKLRSTGTKSKPNAESTTTG
ncbi:hypothetical protein CR513_32599, partial [Mucuna pruriens]